MRLLRKNCNILAIIDFLTPASFVTKLKTNNEYLRSTLIAEISPLAAC